MLVHTEFIYNGLSLVREKLKYLNLMSTTQLSLKTIAKQTNNSLKNDAK